jgi:osmoprotectant transport system substrate-binding protein
MKKVLWLLLAAVLALGVAACGEDLDESNDGGGSASSESEGGGEEAAKPAITVGSANFPENVVLAEIYAGALEAKDFEVSKKLNVGSREAIFPAMERGDISVLPEYSGALLSYLTEAKSDAKEIDAQVEEIKSNLPSGLTVLEPSAAEDKDTITCNKETVDKYGLTSIEDLAKVGNEITIGGPPEFAERAGFGIKALKRVYDAEFKKFQPLDVAGPLTVAALKDNKVQCANLFSTQSAIPANGFITLEDPKGLVEAEAVIPLISDEAATPEATETLNAVSAALNTENLKELVKRVEVDKDDAETVAEDFLSEQGLN